jgi:hypothetical protein
MNAKVRITWPLRLANATDYNMSRLRDAWSDRALPNRHFAVPEFNVPTKRQNTNYVLGYN